MFLNNVKFYVKSTISSTQGVWSTFKISEDFETGTHIETGSNNVSIVLKTQTQIERLTITATGWTATIVLRWLTQADTKIASVWLQKQWNDWTIGYVTAFASDLLDTDSANNTLNANMTYEWNNIFNWNVFLNKWFRVPEFNNATERDTKIPTPEDWMLCYLQDVEDYYSYKNWIWTKWLGWSWWSVTWYQDSTDDWSITWTINWINTTFNLSNTPAQPQAVILTYNGQTLDYGSDYTITGKVITMILVPVSWKLTAIYPDTPVWTGSADTRVTTTTDAHNWELFRNSWDSNSLYYKDNGWDNIKLIDVTSNKIVWTNVDYTWVDLTSNISAATEVLAWVVERATDLEATTWSDTTRYITPKQVKDNYSYKTSIASNNIIEQETTEYINSGTNHLVTWVKIKCMFRWTLNIVYDGASIVNWSSSYTTRLNVTVNWVEVWTERSITGGNSTYVTYTDNIFVNFSDEVQLIVRYGRVKNFSIRWDFTDWNLYTYKFI